MPVNLHGACQSDGTCDTSPTVEGPGSSIPKIKIQRFKFAFCGSPESAKRVCMHTASIQKSSQRWLPEIGADAGPMYLAISAALARDIATGRLRPGDRLPPQRELADALGVDLGTVTRAYTEARHKGLIEAEGRRGSFVLERGQTSVTSIQTSVAPFDLGMNLPPIPANSSFAEDFADTVREVLRGSTAANRMQYQPAGGAPVDRQAGADWLAERGIAASEDNVLVTSGAQTALHAIANSVLKPGDAVCTGPFVYPGWLSICRNRGLRIVPLEGDAEGITPESFARACTGDAIRAIYLVPVNENPTTATLPLARREEIVSIARRHDVALIEDDPYSRLDTAEIPSLASLAPERTWHVAGFSKIISPSLRIAYLRAPHVRDALRLAADVHETTIMAPPLNMAVCTQWLRNRTWRKLVDQVRNECLARQEMVRRILPTGTYHAAPEGYHLWIPLGPTANPLEFVSVLQPLGVSLVTSESFSAIGETASRSIRLSIGGSLDQETLERGLNLLDALLNHREGRLSPLV
ncbi:PLP-dependent aminotransferase family protein [Novosphingobium sp. KN65.2]|uniref:aminotransferase-like domain-containing protein n=1 Tax=Novosphingobium sp. KN65.2 TaxID=1478134 RepID=UPI001E2FA994|nr:PLP-dependent aminotransferase family protein [Novosphingobium sp. KN65.2]